MVLRSAVGADHVHPVAGMRDREGCGPTTRGAGLRVREGTSQACLAAVPAATDSDLARRAVGRDRRCAVVHAHNCGTSGASGTGGTSGTGRTGCACRTGRAGVTLRARETLRTLSAGVALGTSR